MKTARRNPRLSLPSLAGSRASVALCLLLGLAACAGAPVQEMSDARQAVAVASQAHAEKRAPSEMARAQKYLDAAQHALDQGDYSTARDDAFTARQAAIKALSISQRQDTNDRPPP